MPFFYKGVGIGTHWYLNDPRTSGGFRPHQPGIHEVAEFVNHISNATTTSPYISLTRSYEVAYEYANEASRTMPTATLRPRVYRIRLNDPLPPGIVLYDPIEVIAAMVPGPLANIPYHHDGSMNVIVGLAQPNTPQGQAYLSKRIMLPGGSFGVTGAKVTPELNALVRAIRDAEVLCLGTIPSGMIDLLPT